MQNSLEAYTKFFASDWGKDAADRNRRVYLQPFEDWVNGEDIDGELLASYRISLGMPRQKLNNRGRPCVSLSSVYKTRVLGAIKAYLNWCRAAGKLEIDKDTIYDMLKGFKRGSGGLPRVLYREEITRLLDAVVTYDSGHKRTKPIRRFVVMGLLTFARRNELLKLTWRDVDFDRQLIRYYGSKTKVWREVPFKHSAVLPDFLREWRSRDRGRDNWLDTFVARPWAAPKSKTWANQWSTRFQKLMAIAGIKGATPQVMRRTGISYLASARFYSEVHLNIMSGHSGDVSKRFYQHPVYEDLTSGDRDAKLEEYMGANFGKLLALEPYRGK